MIRTVDDSYVKRNKTGQVVLTVYYNNALRDFDEKIEKACRRHRINRRTVTVIALPKKGNK